MPSESQMIDVATMYGIPVTIEVRTKTEVSFKVGPHRLSRAVGTRRWNVNGSNLTFSKSGAIAVALSQILGK